MGNGPLRNRRTNFRERRIRGQIHHEKVNGDLAAEHYKRTDLTTGEVYWITPEFSLMSRGGRKNTGGIGKEWFDKWGRDVYPHDFVVMKNQKLKPPRYYDQLLAKIDAEGAALIKLERQFNALSQAADNTPKRLRAKEIVQQPNSTKEKGSYENAHRSSKGHQGERVRPTTIRRQHRRIPPQLR